MEKIFIISAIVTSLFVVAKLVEMKFIEKEMKPLKFIVRDSVIVFVCSICTLLGYTMFNTKVMDFMNVVTDSKIANLDSTAIFTDEPGF
jgi:hypothetical protein